MVLARILRPPRLGRSKGATRRVGGIGLMATAARRDDGVGAGISWVQRLVAGIIGGIVGGLAFGALMAMMGMLPMVASIVGSKSAVVGFLYHMFNSVVIGALFGLILGGLSHTYARGATFGLLYGVRGWVLGRMILMPLLLGMGSGA